MRRGRSRALQGGARSGASARVDVRCGTAAAAADAVCRTAQGAPSRLSLSLSLSLADGVCNTHCSRLLLIDEAEERLSISL
jgi:hypothetical protein